MSSEINSETVQHAAEGEGRPLKVYVATGLEHAGKAKTVMNVVRAEGDDITYDWTTHGSVAGQGLARKVEVARAEMNGVLDADVVIVILPGGRGTHMEFGMACAAGKPVWLIDCTEGDAREVAFYNLPNVKWTRPGSASHSRLESYVKEGWRNICKPGVLDDYRQKPKRVAVNDAEEHERYLHTLYGSAGHPHVGFIASGGITKLPQDLAAELAPFANVAWTRIKRGVYGMVTLPALHEFEDAFDRGEREPLRKLFSAEKASDAPAARPNRAPQHCAPGYVQVVFDGPPGRLAPRFVEVEDATGFGLNYGLWRDRGDGTWSLDIPHDENRDEAERWRAMERAGFDMTKKGVRPPSWDALFEAVIHDRDMAREDLKGEPSAPESLRPDDLADLRHEVRELNAREAAVRKALGEPQEGERSVLDSVRRLMTDLRNATAYPGSVESDELREARARVRQLEIDAAPANRVRETLGRMLHFTGVMPDGSPSWGRIHAALGRWSEALSRIAQLVGMEVLNDDISTLDPQRVVDAVHAKVVRVLDLEEERQERETRSAPPTIKVSPGEAAVLLDIISLTRVRLDRVRIEAALLPSRVSALSLGHAFVCAVEPDVAGDEPEVDDDVDDEGDEDSGPY